MHFVLQPTRLEHLAYNLGSAAGTIFQSRIYFHITLKEYLETTQIAETLWTHIYANYFSFVTFFVTIDLNFISEQECDMFPIVSTFMLQFY